MNNLNVLGQNALDSTAGEKLLDVTALSDIKTAPKYLHDISFKVERVSKALRV